MGLLNILVVFGIVSGIGLLLGTGTGVARGRHGMPRARTLLMAALYPVLVFPLAGVATHLLLSLSGIQLWDSGDPEAVLQALLILTVAGLVASFSSTIAAFFAHTLAWNRHHARQIGSPTPK